MNPYQFVVSCSICGGAGMGTMQTNAAAWSKNNTIAHRDPRICQDVLRRKREQLDAALKSAQSLNV